MMFKFFAYHCLIILIILFNSIETKNQNKKKNLADYTDAEFERIYEQWEVF